MKKTLFFILAALGFMAQPAQTPDFHYFDHRNLIVVQGQIMNIESEELYGKKAAFLMLSVQSEDQRLFRVEVCPQWFLAADIAVGMKIRVRGSLLEIPSAALYLIAQEISIQGERITLRDSKGFPLWNRSGGYGQGKRRGAGSRGRK